MKQFTYVLACNTKISLAQKVTRNTGRLKKKKGVNGLAHSCFLGRDKILIGKDRLFFCHRCHFRMGGSVGLVGVRLSWARYRVPVKIARIAGIKLEGFVTSHEAWTLNETDM